MEASGTRCGETGGTQGENTGEYRGLLFKSSGISAQKDDEDLFSMSCHCPSEALLIQNK